jgi:hypothetical protein
MRAREPFEHRGARRARVLRREQRAEHGQEREQPEHADAEAPALGPEQEPADLAAHAAFTLGSSTK